ncbi:MAG TPA: hypothetical protein PKA58_22080, partial [Polyangium sp.]|nr:hypothetical protein [Polyangium sp.]
MLKRSHFIPILAATLACISSACASRTSTSAQPGTREMPTHAHGAVTPAEPVDRAETRKTASEAAEIHSVTPVVSAEASTNVVAPVPT